MECCPRPHITRDSIPGSQKKTPQPKNKKWFSQFSLVWWHSSINSNFWSSKQPRPTSFNSSESKVQSGLLMNVHRVEYIPFTRPWPFYYLFLTKWPPAKCCCKSALQTQLRGLKKGVTHVLHTYVYFQHEAWCNMVQTYHCSKVRKFLPTPAPTHTEDLLYVPTGRPPDSADKGSHWGVHKREGEGQKQEW